MPCTTILSFINMMFVYFKYLYVTFVSSCTTNKNISFAADIYVNHMPMLTIVILVPHRSDVSFTRVGFYCQQYRIRFEIEEHWVQLKWNKRLVRY